MSLLLSAALAAGLAVFPGGILNPAQAADLTFTGKLLCALKRPVILAFPAEILSLEVSPGQKVKTGEVLARYRLTPEALQVLNRRLSAPQLLELQAKLAEADKGLTTLRGKEKGLRELSRQNLAAPQSLTQLEQEIKALARQRAALQGRLEQERQFSREDEALLRKQLGVPIRSGRVPEEGALLAPIDGYVVWMHPELQPGVELKGATPVIMVGIMDPMLLKARVFEIEALRLKMGETADITIESLPGRTFQARVSRLPWAPPALSLEHPTYYEVEFQVPNPDLVLREGLKATLVIREKEPKPPAGPPGK